MIIRRYRDADLERLKELTVEGFRNVSVDYHIERLFGPIAGKDWKWRKARHIDQDVAANPDGVFVAEEDGRVVGYITTRVDRDAKIGWIPNLAVDEAYRQQGLGRRLMQTAIDYLRDEGMLVAKIETLATNEVGGRFYPAVGFQEVVRQIHYAMPLK